MIRATGGDRGFAEEVAAAIGSWLARDGVELVSAPPRRERSALDVRAAIERARDDFHHLRFEAAAAAVAVIDAAARERGGEGFERSELVELDVLSAAIALASGDDALAATSADRALAIEPGLVLDPATWAPPVIAAFEARRPHQRRCTLSVQLAPTDARLVLDGREVDDEAPLSIGCGDHVLHAYADDRETYARALTLEANEVLPISLSIDVARVLAAPGEPRSSIGSALYEAARALDAELLVLDIVRLDGGAARAALLGAGYDASASSDTADEQALARALFVVAPEPPHTEEPWPWVLVGAAIVAAVAGGIALGVALSPGAPSGFDVRGTIAP